MYMVIVSAYGDSHMPTLKELERWMSTGQVAKRIGWSRQGVLNLAEEKRLRAVKTGAGWIYDPNSVEEFGRKQKNWFLLRGEEE